jgi:hypothetical protein
MFSTRSCGNRKRVTTRDFNATRERWTAGSSAKLQTASPFDTFDAALSESTKVAFISLLYLRQVLSIVLTSVRCPRYPHSSISAHKQRHRITCNATHTSTSSFNSFTLQLNLIDHDNQPCDITF